MDHWLPAHVRGAVTKGPRPYVTTGSVRPGCHCRHMKGRLMPTPTRRDSLLSALAAMSPVDGRHLVAGVEDESIGALLTRARLEQGKSQLHLAEQLCAAAGLPTITRHEISRWEQGKRIPSRTWLPWLAVVLDTPLDE